MFLKSQIGEFMQDRERDTDVYNGLLNSEGGRGWDDLGE